MLTKIEWQILHVIWDRQPVTARELSESISSPSTVSAATLKTTLHRLVDKQILRFQRKGNHYLYFANLSRAECVAQATNDFVNSVFGGNAVLAMAYLSESTRLGYHQVQYLLELLTDIRDACAVREKRDSENSCQTGDLQTLT